MKLWHKIQHIYINWKRESKGKVTQYDTSPPTAIYVFIPNKVFQTHKTGNLSKHSWESHQCILHMTATCTLCTESTFLWMHQDIEAGNILGETSSSVSLAFLDCSCNFCLLLL
jgi:hypothetical protein